MKIELQFKGAPMVLEGPKEEIRTALNGALRSNAEFYAMCKDLLGTMMYEEVQDRVAAELAQRKSSRIAKRLAKVKN